VSLASGWPPIVDAVKYGSNEVAPPDAALGHRADTWIMSVGKTPEKELRKALLASLESIEYALRLDSAAEVLEESEVRQIDDSERKQTAHVLGELRRLERRWPAPTP
jgi:hypothetical protein